MMHKNKRIGLRRRLAKPLAIEAKIQALAFSGKPEARRELLKMADNRHWFDREFKGALCGGLKDADKAPGAVTRSMA